MNKYVLLFMLIFFLSCNSDDSEENDLLPYVPVNETIFLNNPEFVNLQIVGGWAYASGGVNGIIIYHMSSNNYLAFERSAPHLTPTSCSKMVVKSNIIMYCSCDESEFSILSGAPMTDGVEYAARQYRVDVVGTNTLRITNY